MNFATLLSNLKAFDATAALIFEADDQTIGASYHVTELRHSTSTGIDCGGKIETWQEARLQLLDGHGGIHMSVGKFSDILDKSIRKLPKLSEAELLVEFAPDNSGLKLMALDAPSEKDGRVSLRLRNSKAVCKPAQRSATLRNTSNTASDASSPAARCCGSNTPPNGCCT